MSIVVNNATIRNLNFYNPAEADLLGLMSMSAWDRKGRRLKADAAPTGIVSQEEIRSKGLSIHPTVRDLGNGYYLVSPRWYLIYPEDQTEPKTKDKDKNKEEVNTAATDLFLKDTFPPSSTPAPITMVKSSYSLGIQGDSAICPETVEEAVNRVRAYAPEGLDLTSIQSPYRDNITYFLGLIWRKRVEQYLTVNQFVPLKAEYLRGYVVGFREFWPLIRDKIVERDGYYVEGQKAYGYRLTETYRSRPHCLTEIKDKAIVKRVVTERRKATKLPVHRHLRDNLDRVTIDTDAFREKFADFDNYEHYVPIVQTITDRQMEVTVDDFAGRYHTPLTRLYKPLRSLLRADGQRLAELDIRNSQPLFLGLHLRQQKIPSARYLELVQTGQLYDYLADNLGISRDEAKEELLKTFYSKNGYCSPLKKMFAEEFPEVAEYIHKAKAKDHRRLAQTMQKAEARFVIHTVCDRIMEDHPETFIATIHDSLVCKIEDVQLVRDAIVDEFKSYEITPRLRTTTFDIQYETNYHNTRERHLKILAGGRDVT